MNRIRLASADPPLRIARRRVRFQGCSLNPRESGIPLAVNATIARTDSRHAWWPTLEIALIGFAVISFAVVVWVLTIGGFSVVLLGIRISAWDVYKPMRNGAVCTVLALWLYDRTAARRATWIRLQAWAPKIAATVAAAATIVSIAYGVHAAGASDGFGYISQSRMWASGHVVWRDSFAALVPLVGRAAPPLGYDLARTPGDMVPTYAPGLPIAMAIASRIGGSRAVYLVVPLLAGCAVWWTYVLGAHLAGRRAGMMAATLLAFSPIFVFQSIEPMSDVPATSWWLLAWVFAVRSGRWQAFASGLAASAAVLTRPNLVVLGPVLLFLAAARSPRVSRAALFATGLAPACLAIAGLNLVYHGSPFRSGYGPLSTLYEWSNVKPNFFNYGRWLLDLHSPAVLLGLIVPWAARVRRAGAMLGFIAVLVVSYLFYGVFDNWTYLRFLLPGIPLLLILTAAVLQRGIDRLPGSVRGAAIFLALLLVAWSSFATVRNLNVFGAWQVESRYESVGVFVGHRLPPNAVVITALHSGSVRWYGERATIRWDWLPMDRLDAAIDTLRANGYRPFILLDGEEEAEFRMRFADVSVFGRVDWPPAIEYLGLPKVRVYSVDDRARYLAGARILPAIVPLQP